MKTRPAFRELWIAIFLLFVWLFVTAYQSNATAQGTKPEEWVVGAKAILVKLKPPFHLLKGAYYSDEDVQRVLTSKPQIFVTGTGFTRFASVSDQVDLPNLQSLECAIDIIGAGWTRCASLVNPNERPRVLQTLEILAQPTFTATQTLLTSTPASGSATVTPSSTAIVVALETRLSTPTQADVTPTTVLLTHAMKQTLAPSTDIKTKPQSVSATAALSTINMPVTSSLTLSTNLSADTQTTLSAIPGVSTSRSTQIWVGLAFIGAVGVIWFVVGIVIPNRRRAQTKPNNKVPEVSNPQLTTLQESASQGLNSSITGLRNILAILYPDDQSIRRVIHDAGFDSSRIVLKSSSVNDWQSILSEANKINQVEALLRVVEQEYGKSPEFQIACKTYRESI